LSPTAAKGATAWHSHKQRAYEARLAAAEEDRARRTSIPARRPQLIEHLLTEDTDTPKLDDPYAVGLIGSIRY
jgi:hypothetical protein